VDEREVLLAWRSLPLGQGITPETLAKAESILDGMSGESPLHLRLATELEELKQRSMPKPKLQAKKAASRRSKS
jgi:hypothetical protein